MTSKHTMQFRYDDTIRRGLEAIKERDGMPYHEQVRRAVLAWLEAKGIALEDRNGKRAERVARLTGEHDEPKRV